MKVAEFRKSMKECLDAAAQGKLITIERGGLVFELTVTNHVVVNNVVKTQEDAIESVKTLKGRCKHGNIKGNCFDKSAGRMKCNV